MKNLLIAAVASMAIAAPAYAAPVTIDITGSVPLSCEVIANPSIVNPEAVDLTNTTTEQVLGSLTYTCNNPAGFTRTMSSSNAGVLKRSGGGAGENTIAYQARSGGGSGLGTALAQLTAPVITNLGGSTAFIAGQTGSVAVKIGAASGPLFAGNYGDTITVSISPN